VVSDEPVVVDESRDARSLLEEQLDKYLTGEQLSALLNEVLKITKQSWANCPSCKKRVMVEIPDAKAVVGAMGDLLTQAKGRPDGQQKDSGIVVNRQVYVVAE
jgi:hypothetical protein